MFRLRESVREEDYWLWSEKINLDTRGVNVCLVQTADRSDARVLRITVNSIPPITYITIEEERRGEMTFKHKPVEKLAVKNARQISIKADIKKLGVSVISSVRTSGENVEPERKEILYLLFRGIDFKVAEDLMTKSLHLKLKYLNIDNNSYYHTPFPVLLTPADPRSLANNPDNYFIEANVVQKLYSDITAFDLIHVKLGDSIMKLDNTFRNSVLDTVHNFFEAFTNQNLYASKKSLKLSLSSKALNLKKKSANHFTEWGWMTVPYNTAMGPTLFIKQLNVEALSFSLSSRLDRKQTEQDIFNILDLAMSYQRLESAKSNSKLITLLKKITRKDIVSNDALLLQDAARIMAPLVSQLDTFSLGLKDISMRNTYDYPQDIAKVVATKYMTNAAKLVWRLFEAMGKQRVSKILNPDQNIINPLLEEEYRVQREKLQERRKACMKKIFGDDLDNLLAGKNIFKTPLKGDDDDIPAVEEKSFHENEEELEISRIFPLRRNTSEVIEDVYIALDEKANKHRIRLPRAFYGKEKFYRDYIHCDAELFWLLQFLEGGRYKDISILRSFAGFYNEEDLAQFYVLVISFEKIIWWSAKDDTITWTIDPSNIDRVDYAGRDGVVIYLKNQVENIQGISVKLKNHDKIKNRLIYEELAILLGYRRKNYLI